MARRFYIKRGLRKVYRSTMEGIHRLAEEESERLGRDVTAYYEQVPAVVRRKAKKTPKAATARKAPKKRPVAAKRKVPARKLPAKRKAPQRAKNGRFL